MNELETQAQIYSIVCGYKPNLATCIRIVRARAEVYLYGWRDDKTFQTRTDTFVPGPNYTYIDGGMDLISQPVSPHSWRSLIWTVLDAEISQEDDTYASFLHLH